MPNGPVDPSTLEGDDLIRWYQRPLWQVDQERRAAAAQRYADFFGSPRGPQSDADATHGSSQAPQFPTSQPDVGSFGGVQSQGLSLDPSKPIWAPGAVSTSPPAFSSTSLLPLSDPQTSPPRNSPTANPEGPPGVPYHPPSAGVLGALFPWAVPTPGDGTLKSSMVTNPAHPRVGPDPSRVDVFQRGADGQLHPIPGWHTTGPADFGTGGSEIHWDKVGSDLQHIADSVLDVEGVKAAGEALLDALGPGLKNAIRRGIFGPGQQHHPIPKFMGGPVNQALADLAPPMHREFHKELQSELRKAGLPPVGGKSGSTDVWLDLFERNPAARDKAMDVLQRTTRNFDISRGTSINPYLDSELRIMKPKTPLSSK